MQRFISSTLLVLLVGALSLPGHAGPIETYYLNSYAPANDYGTVFGYESLVQSPGEDGFGGVYTEWWYDYYIVNNSLDLAITGWTWSHGPYSGAVMPNPHPGTTVGFDSSPIPLPAATGPTFADVAYREEYFDDPDPFIQVDSTIHWDSGSESSVPIYVPANLVPEPDSLLALATGLVGAIGWVIRRTRA